MGFLEQLEIMDEEIRATLTIAEKFRTWITLVRIGLVANSIGKRNVDEIEQIAVKLDDFYNGLEKLMKELLFFDET